MERVSQPLAPIIGVLILLGTACHFNEARKPAEVAAPAGFCGQSDSSGKGCSLWEPTVIELLARPELYTGKPIRTVGFLSLEFEGQALYHSREDFDHLAYFTGVWVEVPDSFLVKKDSIDQAYVILEGRFRAGRAGHMGGFRGLIDSVTRLDRWRSHAEMLQKTAVPLPNPD